ncbi:MAG: heavy metal-binding domain-containing protein [Phycisphaerales bacterium]|nr:heavy metal-binding domain-containing protein [Phycisphaerales bacterium]
MQDSDTAESLLGLAFVYGIPVLLLAAGFGAGRHAERKHLKNLAAREAAVAGVMLTNVSWYPGGGLTASANAVYAEAVIATDYFKEFLGKLVKFFGGELRAYRRLMDRARREAIVRLAEQARDAGCDAVCNVRLASADVGGSTSNRKGAAMVAILAWGTAYKREQA